MPKSTTKSIGFTISAELHQAFKVRCAERGMTMTKAMVAFIEAVVSGDYDEMLLAQSAHLASQCRDCTGSGTPTKAALHCAHCGEPFSWLAEEGAGDESAS